MPRVLIVGQGIAGTLLAYCLEKSGAEIHIVDKGSDYSASANSSGLINPITGRNFVKSWMVEHFLPEAIEMYSEIGQLTGKSLHRPISIYRQLSTRKDENQWMSRMLMDGYEPYMAEPMGKGPFGESLEFDGVLALTQQGVHIDTATILAGLGQKWKEKGQLQLDDFQYTDLGIEENGFEYKSEHFDKLVFCEGWRGKDNPFFPELLLQPYKGDFLLLRIADFPINQALKIGMFIIHLRGDLYWIGSANSWQAENTFPEVTKYCELEKFVKATLKIPYTIVAHQSGIRPSTKSRRPFVRQHPVYASMYNFNGLGTKGISCAPYFARRLADSLIGKSDIRHTLPAM